MCSHVARLIREERQRQNLSLNALAARAGLSRQMVTFVEREERNPSLDTVLRLSSALGIKSRNCSSKLDTHPQFPNGNDRPDLC